MSEKECQWLGCDKSATVHVARTNSDFCDDHFLLNVLRLGVSLEGEPIEPAQEVGE